MKVSDETYQYAFDNDIEIDVTPWGQFTHLKVRSIEGYSTGWMLSNVMIQDATVNIVDMIAREKVDELIQFRKNVLASEEDAG